MHILQGLQPEGSDPAGIRTQDPYIKSVMLYRLSYGIICLIKKSLFCKVIFDLIFKRTSDFFNRAANITAFLKCRNIFKKKLSNYPFI